MQICPQCGRRMAHVRRRRIQRLVYSERFACHSCHSHLGRYYPFLSTLIRNLEFIFSRYSRCARCGSQAEVSRLQKRDRIDAVSRNPLALFQRLLGAPIVRCSPCRLQFYDWRRPLPSTSPKTLTSSGENTGT